MAPTPKPADWIAIEGEYRAGIKSLREIGAEHGISEATVRKRAKKEGWLRNPTETKRQIVAARMAGGTQEGTQYAARTIADAADLDVQDMERGLRVHRLCLTNLEMAAEITTEPRDIKTIVEAAAAAVASIRKIRGLDDDKPQNPNAAQTVIYLPDNGRD